jgi:hypothetical protein
MRRFWLPQRLKPPLFDQETPPLQPDVFYIKCLHPIFSMDLDDILSLVSQDHSFKHYVIWVGTLSNVWMLSYWPPNQIRLGPIERYAPIYQVQVVLGDVNIEDASMRFWKRSTQSALTETLSCRRTSNFLVCFHLEASRRITSRPS